MKEPKEHSDIYGRAADTLFEYLRDVIYAPAKAFLDVDSLPQEFRDFGSGLKFFSDSVIEATAFARQLAGGNLKCDVPNKGNEIAAPLKMLHSSLKHLTWQAQQVASGDYKQRVDFMGDFSKAFNNMIMQLEERWKASLNEKYRLQRYVDLLLSNFPDPVLLFDRQKRLLYVSDSYLMHCGLESSDGIIDKRVGELFAKVVPAEFLRHIEEMFERVSENKRAEKTEWDIDFNNDGLIRNYQIQLTPMLDPDGRTEGVLMMFFDTTEITQARRDAEHARELAEKSSRAKSEFLARMSHEMRTPLNAIIGMTTIYAASNDGERKDYCVSKIDEASGYLSGVISDVLDMSNMDADNFRLKPVSIDIKKTLLKAAKKMEFRFQQRKQSFTVTIDSGLPDALLGDGQRITQVVTNLLSNAAKFTPEGGKISLTAEKVCEKDGVCMVRVTVEDNGIGISDEQQKRLFVPFEQADGGVARRYSGTGLGLAISKRIVELMGGKIAVRSETGKGSVFTVEIPASILESCRLSSISGGEGKADIPAVPAAGEDGLFAGRKILLVEDIEINREILMALLEHTGIEIDNAADGIEAIEKFAAAETIYDLIFMDINMPNLDGYEATKRIRASGLPSAETIPIIAMTANVFKEDIEKCLICGMNAHLGKPIEADEVIAALKEYLL